MQESPRGGLVAGVRQPMQTAQRTLSEALGRVRVKTAHIEFTRVAVSVVNPQGTEETGNDRPAATDLCFRATSDLDPRGE